MTDVEYEDLIRLLQKNIEDLTIERDRLKEESANASEALMQSNEVNSELSDMANDMQLALEELGVE